MDTRLIPGRWYWFQFQLKKKYKVKFNNETSVILYWRIENPVQYSIFQFDPSWTYSLMTKVEEAFYEIG